MPDVEGCAEPALAGACCLLPPGQCCWWAHPAGHPPGHHLPLTVWFSLAHPPLLGCTPCNWHLPWQVAQIQVLQYIWHHVDEWVVFNETSSNTLTLYCLSWHWVKLTPRLCWLLQQWNYCCVIALDGLAGAEFKEFDEHKVELNLTWPMVKSNADRGTCNISTLQLKFDHQKGCLSLSWSPSSDTMFYLWVVVCLYGTEWGSWMGCMGILNGAYDYCPVSLL